VDPELAGVKEMQELQAVVTDFVSRRDRVRVLEAGCGSLTHVDLGERAYVVGIDISEIQLEKNSGLDEKILGDVESHDFPAASFDAIACWYVFEHLKHPERALARFAKSLRPGGIIVLALPNAHSVKGLITKFTPFRFHTWVRRRLLGRPHAGTPGHGPFPTFLRFSVAPQPLRRLAAQLGLSVRYLGMFEDPKQAVIRKKFGMVGPVWRWVQGSTRALTGGRLETARTECLVVLQAL
jgi:SAM-dependent methyltransferase